MSSYCAKCGKIRLLIKRIPSKYIELEGIYLKKKVKKICGECLSEINGWIVKQVILFKLLFILLCPLFSIRNIILPSKSFHY
jgi:hypothetical protein